MATNRSGTPENIDQIEIDLQSLGSTASNENSPEEEEEEVRPAKQCSRAKACQSPARQIEVAEADEIDKFLASQPHRLDQLAEFDRNYEEQIKCGVQNPIPDVVLNDTYGDIPDESLYEPSIGLGKYRLPPLNLIHGHPDRVQKEFNDRYIDLQYRDDSIREANRPRTAEEKRALNLEKFEKKFKKRNRFFASAEGILPNKNLRGNRKRTSFPEEFNQLCMHAEKIRKLKEPPKAEKEPNLQSTNKTLDRNCSPLDSDIIHELLHVNITPRTPPKSPPKICQHNSRPLPTIPSFIKNQSHYYAPGFRKELKSKVQPQVAGEPRKKVKGKRNRKPTQMNQQNAQSGSNLPFELQSHSDLSNDERHYISYCKRLNIPKIVVHSPPPSRRSPHHASIRNITYQQMNSPQSPEAVQIPIPRLDRSRTRRDESGFQSAGSSNPPAVCNAEEIPIPIPRLDRSRTRRDESGFHSAGSSNPSAVYNAEDIQIPIPRLERSRTRRDESGFHSAGSSSPSRQEQNRLSPSQPRSSSLESGYHSVGARGLSCRNQTWSPPTEVRPPTQLRSHHYSIGSHNRDQRRPLVSQVTTPSPQNQDCQISGGQQRERVDLPRQGRVTNEMVCPRSRPNYIPGAPTVHPCPISMVCSDKDRPCMLPLKDSDISEISFNDPPIHSTAVDIVLPNETCDEHQSSLIVNRRLRASGTVGSISKRDQQHTNNSKSLAPNAQSAVQCSIPNQTQSSVSRRNQSSRHTHVSQSGVSNAGNPVQCSIPNQIAGSVNTREEPSRSPNQTASSVSRRYYSTRHTNGSQSNVFGNTDSSVEYTMPSQISGPINPNDTQLRQVTRTRGISIPNFFECPIPNEPVSQRSSNVPNSRMTCETPSQRIESRSTSRRGVQQSHDTQRTSPNNHTGIGSLSQQVPVSRPAGMVNPRNFLQIPPLLINDNDGIQCRIPTEPPSPPSSDSSASGQRSRGPPNNRGRGNRLPSSPPSPPESCSDGPRRKRPHRSKRPDKTPKLPPRPWMPTEKTKKKKDFTLTDEQKVLVLDQYYPGLIHDAVNQNADFNEAAKKFVTPETAVDGNKAEKGMSLLEAFDTRVKYEQITLKSILTIAPPPKGKDPILAYKPVYGPIAHPVVSDIVLEDNVRASAIPVDLQQYIRTAPESDPVRAISCLSRAERLNDYYKEYRAAQTAANLAPPDKIEQAALHGVKTFQIDSLKSETQTVHSDFYKALELVSYIGVTKPN